MNHWLLKSSWPTVLAAAFALGLTVLGGPPPARADTAGKTAGTAAEVIDLRIREHIGENVDAFFKDRLERTAYTYTVRTKLSAAALADVEKDAKRLRKSGIISNFLGSPDADAVVTMLRNAPYAKLTQYVDAIDVNVGFATRIAPDKWQPWIDGLRSRFTQGADAKEHFQGRALPQALSEHEHLLEKEARLARDRALEEIAAKEQADRRAIAVKEQADRRLLDHDAELKNFEHEKEKDDLLRTVGSEREKRRQLTEQLNREGLDEKIARDMPMLLKFLSLGGALGLLLVIALFVLAIGLILSALGLGKRVVMASKEAGSAIQNAMGGQAVKTAHKLSLGEDMAKQVQEIKRAFLAKDPDAKEDMEEFEPELIVELTKIIDELRLLIKRDIATASAQITKLIEGREHDKVMILFDMLGEETANLLYAGLHAKHQRDLQRYFYSVGAQGNQPPKLLYLLAVNFRTMLSATEVLIKTDVQRMFSRMLLCHSDVELAHAFKVMDVAKSSAMLAILPPQRVVNIMRQADPKSAASWRQNMVRAVKGEVPLYLDDVKKVEETVNAPEKVAFEECVGYLKDLVGRLDEIEAEDILVGAETDPKLKAAIGGLRASMNDLWIQPLPILQKLFANMELAHLASLLIEADLPVRERYVADLFGRRKELLVDELRNLADEKAARLAVRANAKARRRILDALADLADQGECELPFTRADKATSRPALKAAG